MLLLVGALDILDDSQDVVDVLYQGRDTCIPQAIFYESHETRSHAPFLGNKGDILLFLLRSRASYGPEGGFEAKSSRGSLLPVGVSPRRAAIDAGSDGRHFRFGHRAVDGLLPIATSLDGTVAQKLRRVFPAAQTLAPKA